MQDKPRQCNTIRDNTRQYKLIQDKIIHDKARQHNTMQSDIRQYMAIHEHSIHGKTSYNTIQHNTMQD